MNIIILMLVQEQKRSRAQRSNPWTQFPVHILYRSHLTLILLHIILLFASIIEYNKIL